MERWIRSLLAMFVLLALAAQAQRADKKGGKARGGGKAAMQQIDANGDGQVDDEEAENFARTRAEHLKKQLETIVKKFDANGDGALDADEAAKMKNQLAERGGKDPSRFLKQIDKDGDFKISEEEETNAVEGFVTRARQAGKAKAGKQGARDGQQARTRQVVDPDTNGDCIVDEQEARIEAERRVGMARKQLEMFKQRQAQNPEVKMPRFMAMVDTNKDGELSGEEANAIVEKVMQEFAKRNELILKIFDDNKDGALDDAEQAAAKKALLYMKETQRMNAERMRKTNGQRGGQKAARAKAKAKGKRRKKGADQ
jgi:Ca2+-binding EF-hand superfamily protein